MANVYQSQYAKIAIRALNTDSASYALTASFAMNGGGGGGTPGGSNTTVQFNDAGAFSGSGTFTFDKTTNTVRITGSAILSGSVFMPGLTGSTAPQVLLYNTTTGRVSYTASSAFGGVGSGPGGSFNTIQYNNAGNFDGSNNFIFNGSNLVTLTGSMIVSGAVSASFGPSTVGFFGTSSWAVSASRTISSSYSLSSSYALSASYALSSSYALSASYSDTSSFSSTSSLAFTASFITASNVWGPFGSSSVVSASFAVRAITSSYPIAVTGSSLFSRAPLAGIPSTVNNSIFFGDNAGLNATNASTANFIGYQAGFGATNASSTNFIGYLVGYGATNAVNSNFIGNRTGLNAVNAVNSNFIGTIAGEEATNAQESNFIGYYTGYQATNAQRSNFIGNQAGRSASNAAYSNFFGFSAGDYAVNASYSILIGNRAGYNNLATPANSIGSNNIILGTNITLPALSKDSINLGGIIFATGSHSDPFAINPLSTPIGGKVGINVYPPLYNFQVSGTVAFPNLTDTSQTNVVTYNTTTGQLFYTASSAIGGGGSGTPGGSNTQIQYNNNGVFGGVSNLTWNGTTLSATGSFTGSFTGSLLGTASYATTASYALNGGVTQLLAGPNISLSPTNGLGQVTVSSTGGGGGNTATGSYGSFYSTVTQTNVAGTARSMSLNTTDISNGVSISGSTDPFNTYIKTENPGVYDIQFSAQVDKTDSGTDEIWIWLRKNGVNVTDSATSIQLVGNGDHYVAAWNFFVNSAANDYYQLMWYSTDANVRLHAEAGFGVVPGIPSLIVTVNRVDQFLSNTGSFTGSFTGEFTGSLFGTASYSTTASYALTASYVLQAVSSSFASTASFITASNVWGPFGTSSVASASYALTASFAANATQGTNATSSFASSTTWTFTHNLNSRYPIIQTLDSNFNQIVPQNIELTNVNTATITFPLAISGYAIASLGGSNITQINNTASSTFATTGSNTFVGNQTFSGSLIPAGPYTNNTSSYDLGSATAAWRDLYVSNGSIKMISGSNSASIQFNQGTITFTGAPVTLPSSSTVPTASYVTPYEGAWISYTPSWTAASSNPSIGNGTLEGWYKVIGKTCFVRGNIVMGLTTTFGSGEWYVSMPFTASHADAILMTVNLLDNGAAWYNAVLNGARAGFNYKAPMQYQGGAGTALDVNATQPFTWTNSDRFLWNGSYEIA